MGNILSDNENKYLHDVKFNRAVNSMRSMIRAGMSVEEIDQAKNYAVEIEAEAKVARDIVERKINDCNHQWINGAGIGICSKCGLIDDA